MRITKKKLYELIDESLEGITDYECCMDSRKLQCEEIKNMVKRLDISQTHRKQKQ